jgi:surface polysaccharide O-acyltransferase-like enzyme
MACAEIQAQAIYLSRDFLPMTMPQNRDLSFDAFRGIAIAAVVGIHSSAFYLRGDGSERQWNLLMVAYQQLFNFAVPAFIFISGYWLSRKPIKSLNDYKEFLTRRMSRILVPYFLWSFVYIIYEALISRKVAVLHILTMLVKGSAPGPNYYWFIILIAQFYIMTPFLQYLNRSRYGLLFVLIVNIFALIFRYVTRLYFHWSIPIMGLFCSWIIFFQVGLLAGSNNSISFNLRRLRFLIFPAILGFLLASQAESIALLLN